MTADDQIRYEKIKYDITKKQEKHQHYCQVKLINMNFMQVNKKFLLIKEK